MKRREIRRVALLVMGFVLLNGLAYTHARAMLRHTPKGVRTESPEELTFWHRHPIQDTYYEP